MHTHIHTHTCIHTYMYTYKYTYTYIHTWIHIHIHTHIPVHIHIYTYAYAHIYIYISTSIAYAHPVESVKQMCTLMFKTSVYHTHLHMHGSNNTCKCMQTLCKIMHIHSCMRAYSTVQQLLCHGSYCDLILSLARTSCRLLFTARPPACPLAGNPLRDTVRSRNPSQSTLAHDAVATAVLHKHHPIIRVGAGLIQFVYRSHLRLAMEVTRNRNAFSPFFPRVYRR